MISVRSLIPQYTPQNKRTLAWLLITYATANSILPYIIGWFMMFNPFSSVSGDANVEAQQFFIMHTVIVVFFWLCAMAVIWLIMKFLLSKYPGRVSLMVWNPQRYNSSLFWTILAGVLALMILNNFLTVFRLYFYGVFFVVFKIFMAFYALYCCFALRAAIVARDS